MEAAPPQRREGEFDWSLPVEAFDPDLTGPRLVVPGVLDHGLVVARAHEDLLRAAAGLADRLIHRLDPDLALAAAARDPDLLADRLVVARDPAALDVHRPPVVVVVVVEADPDADVHRAMMADLR